MGLSYWETEQYHSTQHLIIIGSGIVGLLTAIFYKEKHPTHKIIILERGWLPEGASTKNAGFACFGSAGEILDDLHKMPEEEVWQTLIMRIEGLQLLRKVAGDKILNFRNCGGYELFQTPHEYEAVLSKLSSLNKAIEEQTGLHQVFKTDHMVNCFSGIKGIIKNQYEGDINTGELMRWLIRTAYQLDIPVLTNTGVQSLVEHQSKVRIETDKGQFSAQKVMVATNGFAAQLLPVEDVYPARAQVLITSPLNKIPFTGTFHLDQGFYYFREINNRILFGGGRNLDLKGETTFDQDTTSLIQDHLEGILKSTILPNESYTIDQRWSGTMGVGKVKKPIIKRISENIICGVRMGGMGVAIGSKVAEQATILLDN